MAAALQKLSSSPTAIDDLLADQVAIDRETIGKTATACAIQAAVGSVKDTLYTGAHGVVDLESPGAAPVIDETPFDIASITKSLVGATLAMQAVDEGLVDWETPIAEILPDWGRRSDRDSHRVSLLHILNHTSGLPAWRAFYLDHPVDPTPAQAARSYDAVVSSIVATELEGPPGTIHAYSDLGYILLTRLLEILFDAPLCKLAEERIFGPLGLRHTTYVSGRTGTTSLTDAVATEKCSRRGRVVCGTVHDQNTNIIGGVSTHAGVFSTATDLLTFGRHLLAIDTGLSVKNPLVSRSTLQFAWSTDAGSSAGHHLAGWDTPSGESSSAGRGFDGKYTVGHLGFTGTAIWIERRRALVSVLLTNRVYPNRENDTIKGLRIAFQEALLSP